MRRRRTTGAKGRKKATTKRGRQRKKTVISRRASSPSKERPSSQKTAQSAKSLSLGRGPGSRTSYESRVVRPGRGSIALVEHVSAGQIPSDLLSAKRQLAHEYLRPGLGFRRYSLLGRTANPEDNVVGVGIGRRMMDGAPSETYTIVFLVEHKVIESAIPAGQRLPSSVGGIPTAVIETGRFRQHQSNTRSRIRPLRPGCSIGVMLGGDLLMAGTLGAVLRRDGVLGLLSNNHVFANENRLPLGSRIIQPGSLDGGISKSDTVAHLTYFVPLDFSVPNQVDCAFAELADHDQTNPAPLPKVGTLRSAVPASAENGMAVEKVGRTSAYTRGTILAETADVRVEYDTGEIVFEDQILIDGGVVAFSQPGDSGALVVAVETKQPVGLIIAGAGRRSIANPIAEVLARLNATVVV
jgi:hypothetical protein